MNVLGLDLSTTATGWCVGNEEKLIAYGVFEPGGNNWLDRSFVVAKKIFNLLTEYDIGLVVIEDTYLKANIDVLKKLTTLRGMVFMVCYENDVDVKVVMPSAWRKKVGIQTRGATRNNLKKVSLKTVQELFGFKLDSDDAAEAILIAYSEILKG